MKTKWKRNLSILASFLLLPSFSHAGVENTVKMGVGYYMPNDKVILPLLITSKDQGAIWSYAPDISSRSILPADFTDEDYPHSISNNSLVSASCQNNFCMAIGRYKNADGAYVPLIGLSQNNGTSWIYTSIKPKNYSTATDWITDPIKTACNSKMCVVAMPYINTQSDWTYLVSTTEDQGHSWSYSKFIPSFPKGDAVISSLDCTEQNCVGVGYVDSDVPNGYLKDGFITISKDQAKTWTFPKLDIPAKYQKYELEDVKCKENICLAKGVGFDAKNTPYLLLLRSTNGGDSWDVIPNDYHVVFNNEMGNGNISYTNNIWAIAGTYIVDKGDYRDLHPFVLISQDDGKTWVQPADIVSKLPDELARTNFTFGELINCSGDHCVLTTITMLRNTMTPALAISHDRGVTWSYINVSPVDLGYFGAVLSYLSCDEKSCVIMGEYSTKQETSKPFLITSNNNGKTWYSPILNIPENVSASFNGGTNTSSSCSTTKQFGIKIKLERLLKQIHKQ